jgi:hypothetical protein
MNYAVEMASDDIIYISNFTPIGSGMQVILLLLHQKFERLQYRYYSWEILKYAVEMPSGGIIYIVVYRLVAVPR